MGASKGMIRFIFLGGLFPKETESLLLSKSKGNFQVAANVLQWGIVNGIESVTGDPLTIVTTPFVGDYPRNYTGLFVERSEFSHLIGSNDYSVGFLNLKILNMFSKYFECKKVLSEIFSKQINQETCIIVYGMFAYLLASAAHIKTKHPMIKICLVIPDLPEMMGGDTNRLIIKIFNYLNSIALRKYLKSVDCFVLLSEHMAEKISVGQRPWCVVEGIAGVGETEICSIPKTDKKLIVLYSGTLALRYGIKDLVDAFKEIEDEQYSLWICGVGDGESYVKEAALNDKRIEYFGQLDRARVLCLQAQATLLVNPRTSMEEFTKYSFPSKVMEYFSSGTPTIMHRLPGVPKEYFDYCLIPCSEDANGLRQAIKSAEQMGLERLAILGAKAKEFVLSQKSEQAQAAKILEMIVKL